MDDHRDRVMRGWTKFLNPEVLKGNLIAASIFLAAYHLLRASIIDRIRDFFTFGSDANGPIGGDEYKTSVLTLDKSPLRASLLWLKEMAAIDDDDLALVDRIREHRNELAHDLPKFIGTAEAEIDIRLLAGIYEILTKVDRWWIRQVEMAVNSDYDGVDVADSDIFSGTMMVVQMMIQIAAGEDPTVYWEAFQRQGDAESTTEAGHIGT